MIILSDSEDFPWCHCEEEEAWTLVVIALPAPSWQFEGVATAFPRRLHDFFTIEELSRPAIPTVDAARVARAAYIRGRHARARESRCCMCHA